LLKIQYLVLQNGWTPLHCVARAGFLDVVKLLVESGASPKAETNFGSAPIWFAASEGHNEVLKYLMTKEHDTYSLLEDKRVRLLSRGFKCFSVLFFCYAYYLCSSSNYSVGIMSVG
jgi:ankyrin repeat protein